jgi:hypothetical protein
LSSAARTGSVTASKHDRGRKRDCFMNELLRGVEQSGGTPAKAGF